MNPKEIPATIRRNLVIWQIQASLLRLVHVALGASAVICSLLVASKINSFSPGTIQWLSFTAAVSVGLLAAFDLGNKANRVRSAWRRITTAVARFQHQDNYSMTQLIDEYSRAEKEIGDVKETPTP